MFMKNMLPMRIEIYLLHLFYYIDSVQRNEILSAQFSRNF